MKGEPARPDGPATAQESPRILQSQRQSGALQDAAPGERFIAGRAVGAFRRGSRRNSETDGAFGYHRKTHMADPRWPMDGVADLQTQV